ncbi:MAG: class I SAM-dependent methyltransferase [Bacteroidales bacterium]
MPDFWEALFATEGALWKFEPSDSALEGIRVFSLEGYHHILIPGFGYGRNAKAFIGSGFEVTGIEISGSAIRLAREHGINCLTHHGSVTQMPFDESVFDAVFCYALIHLLNKTERRYFLNACYRQLKPGGMMIFVTASTAMNAYTSGRYLSRNRYQVNNGLRVFFYDDLEIEREFRTFGLVEYRDVLEPVRFMPRQESLPLKFVLCRKS